MKRITTLGATAALVCTLVLALFGTADASAQYNPTNPTGADPIVYTGPFNSSGGGSSSSSGGSGSGSEGIGGVGGAFFSPSIVVVGSDDGTVGGSGGGTGGTGGGLAVTGSEVNAPLAAGIGLIGLGGIAVIAARKRSEA